MHTPHNAIVVGGGPAGSMVAMRLASMGWNIALIERRARHQNKTCGHCLNPRAVVLLQQHGLREAVETIAVGRTRRLRAMFQHTGAVDVPLGESDSMHRGLIVRRSDFDQLLLDHARAGGVHVHQPAIVSAVQADADYVRVNVTGPQQQFQLRSKLIIGADGLGSRVARAVGLADRAYAGRKYGFACSIPARAETQLSRETIYMFTSQRGYLGAVCERNAHVHIAALVSDAVSNDRKPCRHPLAFMRAMARNYALLEAIGLTELEPAAIRQITAIGPMPWRPHAVANQCAALVGDAAGYIEPFTGEGMSWAIQSACILADVLRDVSPGCWNTALAQRYCDMWKRTIARQHRLCRALAFVLARPWLLRCAAAFCAIQPQLARRLAAEVTAT